MGDNGTRRYPEQTDLQQFKTWLEAHEERFRQFNRPTSDIAFQAIQDGCNPIIVRQWEFNQRFKELPRGGR